MTVGVALLVLGGCRDRSTVQDKQDKLCVQLGEADAAVTGLAALDPSTATVAQLKTLKGQLEAQWKDVEDAAKDVSAFKLDPVRTAYNHFLAVVNPINDQTAFVAAAAQIDQTAGEFSDARLQLYQTAGC